MAKKSENACSEPIFSEDQMEHFRLILRGYPPENVENFLYYLNILCELKKFRTDPYQTCQYDRLILLRNLKKVQPLLKSFVKNDREFLELFAMFEVFCNDTNWADLSVTMPVDQVRDSLEKLGRYNLIQKAKELEIKIANFIESLEQVIDYKKGINARIGRKLSNSDKFYTELATLYQKYIDKPVYRVDKGGTFTEIVILVNAVLGLKPDYSDPSRTIRQALEDIKKDIPSDFLFPLSDRQI